MFSTDARCRCAARSKSPLSYRLIPVCLSIVLFAVGAAVAGIEGPLRILSPATTRIGHAKLRIGASASINEQGMFAEGLTERTVYSLPVIDLAVGMADNVELRLQYPVLFIEEGDESAAVGSGDLRVSAIFDLVRETERVPQCALMLGAKAPNANDDGGFGTDQSDLFAGAVLSKTFGDLTALVSISLGILDNPRLLNTSLCDETEDSTDGTAQDDVLAYGVGALYALSEGWSIGCEVDGVFNSRFGNDRAWVRGGVAYSTRRFTLDLAVGTGLTESSGDIYVGMGVSCHLKPSWF